MAETTGLRSAPCQELQDWFVTYANSRKLDMVGLGQERIWTHRPCLRCSQLLAGDSRPWPAATGLTASTKRSWSIVTHLCLSAALAEHLGGEPDAVGLTFR